jgi:hypothetical protein
LIVLQGEKEENGKTPEKKVVLNEIDLDKKK